MAALADAKRIVIKIGSALLVDGQSGRIRMSWLESLASDIAMLHAAGKDVLIVSSGSIALGRQVLGLGAGALSLAESQAAAAVGQIRLAQAYETVLAPKSIKTAQILLTLQDSMDRRRYLNSRGTIQELFGLGVVPIVNENDTVATDEIRFGDNDRLAAQVAAMIGSDHLILLSDIDGLYTANPNQDPNATLIPVINHITPEMEAGAGEAQSENSRGGMRTKLLAAKTAMAAGCHMSITKGELDHPIQGLLDGAKHSLFVAAETPIDARKAWISSMKPQGVIRLDDGAVRALNSGKSVLVVGVCDIAGEFDRGDVLSVQDQDGHELAHGLAAYNSVEASKIMGQKSENIAQILGYAGRGPIVHRDDLVMV